MPSSRRQPVVSHVSPLRRGGAPPCCPGGYDRRWAAGRGGVWCLIAAALFSVVGRSPAATGAWDGSQDAAWSSAANWDTNAVPGAGDSAVFNSAGHANTVISLGAGVTLQTLTFDTVHGSSYVLGTGAAGSQSLTLGNGGSVMMSAALLNNQLINGASSSGQMPPRRATRSPTITPPRSSILQVRSRADQAVWRE